MNERRRRRIEKNILKDRRYKVLIYNRFVLSLFLVLLQIVIGTLLLWRFYNAGGRAVRILIGVTSVLFVLYIINRNEKPSSKLNWVIMILIMPIFGISLYLLFGEGRPTRRMNRKISAAKKENAGAVEQSAEVKAKIENGGRNGEICRYLMKYAGYPVYDDGDVTYYPSGREMFKDMLEAMESAQKYILVEYFIVAGGKMWDAFRAVLLKKAEEGVRIKMIFDDAGSLFLLPKKYDKYLESLHPNIKCYTFNPVVPIFTMRMNNRDHRKILVVDGKTAFTGGINLADEYIDEKIKHGHWKDSGLRVRGRAVDSFVLMFFNIWNAFRKDKGVVSDYLAPEYAPRVPAGVLESWTGGAEKATVESAKGEKKEGFFVQPYDDSPLDRENVGETVYLDIIHRAEKYLYVFTPYLILDDFMRAALCDAAKRGVDVRIVTPGIPDKKYVFRLTRANYGSLIKAGVKIYEYTPGFIHAKSMIADDEYAVVGTINLDYRSLYLHFENAVYFSDCEAVERLKKDNEEVFAVSRLIPIGETKRNFFGGLLDSVLRVFETLL